MALKLVAADYEKVKSTLENAGGRGIGGTSRRANHDT